MSFSTIEAANLDKSFHRSHYFIDQHARWGDICNINIENGVPLLFVRRPLGYKGLIYVVALILVLLVMGLALPISAKTMLIAVIAFGMFMAITFQPKRDISFYADSEHQRLVFRVAQKKGDSLFSYLGEVRGNHDEHLATIRKEFSAKAPWRVLRPTKELWVRAFMTKSPWWASLLSIIGTRLHRLPLYKLEPYKIVQKESSVAIGNIKSDALELEADPDFTFDRRVALSLAVVIRSI